MKGGKDSSMAADPWAQYRAFSRNEGGAQCGSNVAGGSNLPQMFSTQPLGQYPQQSVFMSPNANPFVPVANANPGMSANQYQQYGNNLQGSNSGFDAASFSSALGSGAAGVAATGNNKTSAFDLLGSMGPTPFSSAFNVESPRSQCIDSSSFESSSDWRTKEHPKLEWFGKYIAKLVETVIFVGIRDADAYGQTWCEAATKFSRRFSASQDC